ncbi:hypothetical protein N657DRAFT_649277 [Parathielavia appendiculata]|uniref:GST N-terminal domain-containing protein n=1 Tax=Parathielavia appendiculata TaxID=2587402 RepID=A0AAN6Z092_9PEZI|nr:hypothetical protein N657DRAFT_649277 [Parathielavia appendiculata]
MSTASAPSRPIVFYDIAMSPPREKTCCSPNPWKTRLALNFKGVPYTTTWVALPDIAKVRTSLNVPACRKFADGSNFFTLPIIEDHATASLLGDSFDIAVHLQRKYPTSGAGDLFPPQTLDFDVEQDPAMLLVPLSEPRESHSAYPEYARFNMKVDAAFTAYAQLSVFGFPFDPATAEATKAEFVRRAGVARWDDFALVGEARERTRESFRNTLGGLAGLFSRDTTGPFLLGTRASYGDFIVGAWLRMLRVTLPESEWEDVRGWHGGVFGRLHDALEVYAEVQ